MQIMLIGMASSFPDKALYLMELQSNLQTEFQSSVTFLVALQFYPWGTPYTKWLVRINPLRGARKKGFICQRNNIYKVNNNNKNTSKFHFRADEMTEKKGNQRVRFDKKNRLELGTCYHWTRKKKQEEETSKKKWNVCVGSGRWLGCGWAGPLREQSVGHIRQRRFQLKRGHTTASNCQQIGNDMNTWMNEEKVSF